MPRAMHARLVDTRALIPPLDPIGTAKASTQHPSLMTRGDGWVAFPAIPA
ncbi:MAG: hypothetical protein GYA24_23400 [Candidatus Lokiarchaeota archaeon]|nr:hypothetical protein [Candidatus Lokiarchaeota archaeon]